MSPRSLVSLVTLLAILGRIDSNSVTGDNDLIQRVYVGLDAVLQFILENIDSMNIDAIFGVALSKAALQGMHTNPPGHLINLGAKILERFRLNSGKLEGNSKLFVKYLLDENIWIKDINFTKGQLVADEKFRPHFADCSDFLLTTLGTPFFGPLSDNCMIEVIMKSLKDGKQCTLSPKCLAYMNTEKYYPSYSITHKLLLLQIGQAFNCKWDKMHASERIKKYCSSILCETRMNEKCGYVEALDDLLLEQIALCGYEGFEEFMSSNWIEHTLEIQSKYGCFGAEKIKGHGRPKRNANSIKYNCVDHTTGLGATVLSVGRQIAKRLVQCGADVIAVGRTQSDLDSIKLEHPSIRTIVLDIQNWSKTKEALKDVGNIDLLVNNAGVAILEPILDVSEASFDNTFSTNVKSAVNLTQIVAKNLIERKAPGAIVNVSSQAGIRAIENHAIYCSSKAALDLFTKVSALELGPHNIRVNSVNPTVIMTDMGRLGWSDPAKADPLINRTPLRRFVEVDEVVDTILYLLSDKASMITGSCLPVDGGILAVL
ncbi:hypothetical protein FQA39_LY04145 [Lamprigera yunnana]|nr:hypothetical protein FQA39_LY04145 [Lamprigera yunnana]